MRITKENAINHECIMVTKSFQLGLQVLAVIINNCAYPGRLLKCSSSSSSPRGSKLSVLHKMVKKQLVIQKLRPCCL